MSAPSYEYAAPWKISQWMNASGDVTLESFRGKVVVMHAFQMLCPGCVSHGIPQAKAIHNAFPLDKLRVVGLHTVFEHHEAMGPVSLKAFIQEYRIPFPVGIDERPADNPVPLTMQAYGLQGTPSLILIDKNGYIRLHHFGQLDDLRAGAAIGQLLAEGAT